MITTEETTTRRTRKGSLKCGFCADTRHDQCSSGVRNGDGRIARCTCGCERSQETRCTDCNNREQTEIGTDWRCLDRGACEAEVQRRLDANPVMSRIKASVERTRERQRLERLQKEALKYDAAHDPEDPMYEILNAPDISKPEKPKRGRTSPKPTGPGKCRCCGEPTKGGSFLPGHDSKFLTRLAEMVVGNEITREEGIGRAAQISIPLGKKAQVRIDRALLRKAVRP